MRVGVDTGGTFTDVVAEDGRVVKVLSSPADPSRAVAAGLTALGDAVSMLAHGTTVATNALLERRGRPSSLARQNVRIRSVRRFSQGCETQHAVHWLRAGVLPPPSYPDRYRSGLVPPRSR